MVRVEFGNLEKFDMGKTSRASWMFISKVIVPWRFGDITIHNGFSSWGRSR
jgi:hypothetical protein